MSYDAITSGRTCSQCSMTLGKGPDWCENCKNARTKRNMYMRLYSEPQSEPLTFSDIFETHHEHD